MRMRHNAIVACLIVEYNILPHDLINGTIKKKIIERKTRVSIFSRTSVWNFFSF